ncbi:hypothetical protein AZE42_12588 [Rhizopogon vesiculosus]|uniref:Uncharacterized protein n=1 Tax=Rhizopogon vesiculosus TaxID=180088 RepID=A0A1J8QU88_9AGAM|nr:hypothetical protein AZE42_12588 [Rhizopogon vesiculosus]
MLTPIDQSLDKLDDLQPDKIEDMKGELNASLEQETTLI